VIDALCEGCRRVLVTEEPRESEGPVLCGRCRRAMCDRLVREAPQIRALLEEMRPTASPADVAAVLKR